MEMTGKVFQNRLRMKALAIRRIAIKGGWRYVAAMGALPGGAGLGGVAAMCDYRFGPEALLSV